MKVLQLPVLVLMVAAAVSFVGVQPRALCPSDATPTTPTMPAPTTTTPTENPATPAPLATLEPTLTPTTPSPSTGMPAAPIPTTPAPTPAPTNPWFISLNRTVDFDSVLGVASLALPEPELKTCYTLTHCYADGFDTTTWKGLRAHGGTKVAMFKGEGCLRQDYISFWISSADATRTMTGSSMIKSIAILGDAQTPPLLSYPTYVFPSQCEAV